MKSRHLLLLLLVHSLIGVALSIWVNVFTGAELIERLRSAGVYEYRGWILIAFIVMTLISAVLIFRHEQAAEETPKTASVAESEISKVQREFLQDLGARYQTRYQHKLDGRFEISLIVSDDLEGTSDQQFNEEFSTDPQTGSAAQYIIDLFERRGRLLIVGSPGAGKTVLLLKLALHLIAKAENDVSQPLPVIFNLASWSPQYERFDDWLKAVLTQGYGLSADFAATMLRERRIVFLLDGLDEVARNEEAAVAAAIRSECLKALNQSLYDGAMNAVICCRREEFLVMRNLTGVEVPVAAKVVVQDLTAEQIERALIRASRSTKDRFTALNLFEALGQDPNGVYVQVLTTPFYFTLALQVFDYSEPPEIAAPDKQTLESNLIKSFVEKKVQVTENPEHFPLAKTLKWLSWLALFLDARQRVVFELADLQPKALKRRWSHKVFTVLYVAFLYGFLMSATVNARFGVVYGALFGVALLTGLGVFSFRDKIVTEDIAEWSLSPLISREAAREVLEYAGLMGVLGALSFSFAAAFGNVFFSFPFLFYVIFGTVWGVICGILITVPDICRRISSFAKLSEPYQRLRAGILFHVLHILVAILLLGLFLFGLYPISSWPQINVYGFILTALFIGGLLFVLASATTPLFRHLVLRLSFTLEGAMPLKYVSFLRYATALRVLEQEGGQWRFRHQNFQDYFSARVPIDSLAGEHNPSPDYTDYEPSV